MNKRFKLAEHNNATEYWMSELCNRAEGTKENYLRDFARFCNWAKMSADELLEQRKIDQKANDIKEQRQIETLLLKFVAHLKDEGFSSATQQRAFAAVRSFFEINYMPLRMRHGDYPQGESVGVKAATKDQILRVVTRPETGYNPANNAVILTIKDCGLRASDIRLLNVGDIQEGIDKNADFISLNIVTKKKKILAKTFIGREAIEAIKESLEARKKGTRRVPFETITKDSPLFVAWSNGRQRISRTGLSGIVRNAFLATGEPNLSAHSLRKYFQTQLEEAGVNANWIDHMIGHTLFNSRGAYSKPTDEKLRTAYEKAYKYLAVYSVKAKSECLQTTAEKPVPSTQQPNTASLEEMQLHLQILQLQLKMMQTDKS